MVALFPAFAALAACIPYTDAEKRVGESVCVSGKVVKVAESRNGAWFLDFCEDYTKCPFTVVVFSRDLRDVGDIRMLVGQDVEIFGKVKLYGGRAEIIPQDARPMAGGRAKLAAES